MLVFGLLPYNRFFVKKDEVRILKAFFIAISTVVNVFIEMIFKYLTSVCDLRIVFIFTTLSLPSSFGLYSLYILLYLCSKPSFFDLFKVNVLKMEIGLF